MKEVAVVMGLDELGTMPGFAAACTLRPTFAAARMTGSAVPRAREP